MYNSQAAGPSAARCSCGMNMLTMIECIILGDALLPTIAERGNEGLLNCHLTWTHQWLVNPPYGRVGVVLDIVCLPTIAALERGRLYLYRHRNEGEVHNLIDQACSLVESAVWERLEPFA